MVPSPTNTLQAFTSVVYSITFTIKKMEMEELETLWNHEFPETFPEISVITKNAFSSVFVN